MNVALEKQMSSVIDHLLAVLTAMKINAIMQDTRGLSIEDVQNIVDDSLATGALFLREYRLLLIDKGIDILKIDREIISEHRK
jgi:hypothetical protein